MFNVKDKVKYLYRGKIYIGMVKDIKWGMAYVDFKDVITTKWIQIIRLEKYVDKTPVNS